MKEAKEIVEMLESTTLRILGATYGRDAVESKQWVYDILRDFYFKTVVDTVRSVGEELAAKEET